MLDSQLKSKKTSNCDELSRFSAPCLIEEKDYHSPSHDKTDLSNLNPSSDFIKTENEERKDASEHRHISKEEETQDFSNFDTSISNLIQSIHTYSFIMPKEVFDHKLSVCLKAIIDIRENKQNLDLNTLRNSESFRNDQNNTISCLKYEKDSNVNSVSLNQLYCREELIKEGNSAIIGCRMFVDPYGYIKRFGPNAKEIFGMNDLVGFNFFDDLMAGYNKTYFTSKFGAYPIINMKRPITVLRYSLKHQDDDLNPVIITSKITLVYSNPKPGFSRVIIGAKIISRFSSDDSTSKFRQKLKICTAKAGQIAIKHMRFQMFLKHNVSLALQNFQQREENLDQTKTEICPFDSACNFT